MTGLKSPQAFLDFYWTLYTNLYTQHSKTLSPHPKKVSRCLRSVGGIELSNFRKRFATQIQFEKQTIKGAWWQPLSPSINICRINKQPKFSLTGGGTATFRPGNTIWPHYWLSLLLSWSLHIDKTGQRGTSVLDCIWTIASQTQINAEWLCCPILST